MRMVPAFTKNETELKTVIPLDKPTFTVPEKDNEPTFTVPEKDNESVYTTSEKDNEQAIFDSL